MKTFEKITNEINGAKNAGYTFDLNAEREINQGLYSDLIRNRGQRFVDNKLDEFCDLDGDLYQDENGDPYAVLYVFNGEHYEPLCWQKLIKKD